MAVEAWLSHGYEPAALAGLLVASFAKVVADGAAVVVVVSAVVVVVVGAAVVVVVGAAVVVVVGTAVVVKIVSSKRTSFCSKVKQEPKVSLLRSSRFEYFFRLK